MKHSHHGHMLPENSAEFSGNMPLMRYRCCVSCDHEFSDTNTHTQAGWLRTQITGYCEDCFDAEFTALEPKLIREANASAIEAELTPVSIRDMEIMAQDNMCFNMDLPMRDPCPVCSGFRMTVGMYACFGACDVCVENSVYWGKL